MANNNSQMQLIMAAAAAIVCIALPVIGVDAAGHLQRSTGGYGYNMAGATTLYDNRWLPLEQQTTSMLHKPLRRYASKLEQEAVGEEQRSYRSHSYGGGEGGAHGAGGLEAMLNGLSNLSGLGRISNGYASVAPTHTEALAAASAKQEIPIYEEHHEDAAVAAVAATANDYGDGGAGASGYGDVGEHQQQHQQQHSTAGLHPTIYDYTAASAGFGGGVGVAGGSGSHGAGYLPAFDGASEYKEQQAQQQAGHHYAYDKISVGNYLNHYDQSSDGFESYRQHHADEQQYQQQQHQQQQQQLEHASYFTPSHEGAGSAAGASAGGASAGGDYEDHPDGDEHGSNFLAESETSGHDGAQAHSHQSHHHVDIINYVPVKHVKKEHVPVEKPVKIPVSHAVIIPIKKPVPIHIPITKQVQVAVEKELKVPVERIIPVPVEKHIPVPVEKRVPYTVIKYLPIKVPKPFPVKVPVFKTVLHKIKGWW